MDLFDQVREEERDEDNDDETQRALDSQRGVGGFGNGGWFSGVKDRDIEFVFR